MTMPGEQDAHEAEDGDSSHAVIVYVKLSDDKWGDPSDFVEIHTMEDRLIEVIEESGTGEFDGIGRGLGFMDFYMYGPDADALFAAIDPVIRSFMVRAGSYVVKRYGEPGGPEVRIEL